jgi:transposase
MVQKTNGEIMMRTPYPSDITREQFEMIREDLENINKETRPRKIDLYEVFCAILYLLKTGCQWRAIPHDFPDYRHVYYYYKIWTKKDENGFSVLDYVQARLTELQRFETRENPVPSMLIIDSKTIQNADTAKEKGYDGGKKKRD